MALAYGAPAVIIQLGGHMGDNNNDPLSHTFAGMLGDLEQAETQLLTRQSELAKQLQAVERELDRIANVRAAMMGQPLRVAKRGRTTTGGPHPYKQPSATAHAVAQILEHLKANGGMITGREAADLVNRPPQGVGPMLTGMVRRGELEVGLADDGETRAYQLPT